MTEWRPIDQHYEVSACGRVRRGGGEEIGQWLNHGGYRLVRLSAPRRKAFVHRLVAEAFLENPNAYPFVNHLNHDREDNRVENIEWCTNVQNLAHMRAAGRQSKHWTGKRGPTSKFTDDDVIQMRELVKSGWDMRHFAFVHSVDISSIRKLVKGKTYSHIREYLP
jgi:hypothetical protein